MLTFDQRRGGGQDGPPIEPVARGVDLLELLARHEPIAWDGSWEVYVIDT